MNETATADLPPRSNAVANNRANAVEAMGAMKYRLGGAVVNQATANLPDAQRSELRWLHSFASGQNIGLDELATMLKKANGEPYSRDSVYQALTGRRAESGSSLEPLCQSIERLRKVMEARNTVRRSPFIETQLTRRMFKYCDAALTFQKIAFLYGASQIGKSTTLLEYKRTHNHGQTTYVRMPTRGSLGEFIRALAVEMRVSPIAKEWQIKNDIMKSFDDRMLLIVDQCHECFHSHYSDRALASLLFVMEIHDRKRCGVVLSGTSEFEYGMMEGLHRNMMVQLVKRGFPKPLRLPDKPTDNQLAEFAAFYGLRPADGEYLDLQSEIIKSYDLGVWLTYLQVASRIASKGGNKTVRWEHVRQAHQTFFALAGGVK